MTNLERLEQAGLIKPGHQFSREDLLLLDSLSSDEVTALIGVRAKVGEGFLRRNTHGDKPPIAIVF
jgi:hypothetical protein